ncbi:hypothetical protein [Vitiosangium sp. GDMCC 1.1324]|uniref:hypothetical protein n=1 Tax=Vitiosangium sp. (strain GDMCC 1.1324) TaxID=2138576 RepID=UPI000D375B55|nr:hypothetical protein [Vitiosangium sp. GDMCC 1.1324]PTL82641.1 hypothetical protein DAT35_17775 [Vitiosangium sp. GDMCC 1.1324]
MPALSPRLRLLLLLAVLLACALVYSGQALAPAHPTAPLPGMPLPLPRDPRIRLQGLPSFRAAYEESFRSKPDARFLRALSELERLLGGSASASVDARFHEDGWILQVEGKEVGRLPEFPDFADALSLLETRAHQLGVKRLELQTGSLPPGASPLPMGRATLETLRELDEAWSRGKRSPATLVGAARASVALALQLTDLTETADAVPARALALLALGRATTSAALTEERALLSHVLGYERTARQLASALPSGGAARAFLLQEDDLLEALAERDAGAGVASHLWVRRLARMGRVERAERSSRLAAQQLGVGLHVVAPRLLMDGTHPEDQFIGRVAAPFILAEVAWANAHEAPGVANPYGMLPPTWPRTSDSDEALLQWMHHSRELLPVKERGLLPLFDELLEKTGRPGAVFLDAEVERAFFRGLFDSALYRSAMHCLDGLATPEATADCTESFGTREARTSGDFQQWYARLVAARKGPRDEQVLLQSLNDLKSLGAPLINELHDELEATIDRIDPARTTMTRRLAARLDTRPDHRVILADALRGSLSNLVLSERLYRASLEACQYPGVESWLAWRERDFAKMKQLLHDPAVGGTNQLMLLEKLLTEKQLTAEEVARELEALVATSGDQWSFTLRGVEMLERARDYPRARALAERWLEWNAQLDDVTRGVVLVKLAHLHALEGNPARGWEVLTPALTTYRHEVLEQGALLLQALGDEKRALAMAEGMAHRYPGPSSLALIAELHWRSGRYAEAAAALKASPVRRLLAKNWRLMGTRFADVFGGKPLEEGLRAFNMLQEGGLNAAELQFLTSFVRTRESWQLSVELDSRIQFPDASIRLGSQLRTYQSLARWKSKAEALEWLRPRVPPPLRGVQLATLAFEAGADDLLWEYVQSNHEGERDVAYTWLLKAASSVRTRDDNPEHRRALEEYFQLERPDFYHQVGRYLLGLTSEEEVLALAKQPDQQQELAFFLALKAQAERRYEDAATWYAAAVEQGLYREGEYQWSLAQLWHWRAQELSLAQLQKRGL